MSFIADELVKWREDPPWYDKIDTDELERLSAIGLQPRQIAMYFRVPENDFLWYFNLVGSPLKYHYERGQLVQTAKEGLTMTAAAERGENVTQAQRLINYVRKLGIRTQSARYFMMI